MELQMIKFRFFLQLKPKDEFLIDLSTKIEDEIQYSKNPIFIQLKLPISKIQVSNQRSTPPNNCRPYPIR